MKIPEINSRISQIIDYKSNGSRKRFSETIGIAQQSINRLFNIDTRTGKYPVATTEIITSIVEMFVDINARWLLTGKGSMLKNEQENIGKDEDKGLIVELIEKNGNLRQQIGEQNNQIKVLQDKIKQLQDQGKSQYRYPIYSDSDTTTDPEE